MRHFAHHKLAGRAGDPRFPTNITPNDFFRWYGTFFQNAISAGDHCCSCTPWSGIYWLVLDIPMAQIRDLLYGLPRAGSSLQLFYFRKYCPHCHRESQPLRGGH